MSSPVSIPLSFVTPTQLETDYTTQRAWLQANGFRAEPGTFCLLPGTTTGIAAVLVGQPDTLDTWTLGSLATTLPPATYHLAQEWPPEIATKLYLGWRLGQYQFNRYKQGEPAPLPTLTLPTKADIPYVTAAIEATFLARDLINTPANDMGPSQLEAAARAIATTYHAEVQVITGEELLTQNYPMIHAVGRASTDAPRLIDLRWGALDAPKVTLVGKGVSFDTGGLDIKPASGMKLMKKDMGGAAHVLGLAVMILKLQLPVRLRVLIPAVENSIAGNAMRPSDILPTRKGITVEIGNTDAEGRLVLGDALWEGVSEDPDLLVDFATLTGAARVALGSELPAFFCNHPETAELLQQVAATTDDPLWPLPLHAPYRELLRSRIADINNISDSSYGGAVTAALFLQEFVKPDIPWIHVDMMAWNLRSLPGRPDGGEAMGLRSLFALIQASLGKL